MDIIKQVMNLSTFLESTSNVCNTVLNVLEPFTKTFNKKSLIHIYGAENTGKTELALYIIEQNKDKVFLYVDTYGNIKDTPDNCLLLRTNKESLIVSLLNELESNTVDCIIIDSYSNILSKTDNWDAETYEVMQEALEHIHNIAVKKNCTLMLLNTENSNGNAFNRTNYLKINSFIELRLLHYYTEANIIELATIKSRGNCNNITNIYLRGDEY